MFGLQGTISARIKKWEKKDRTRKLDKGVEIISLTAVLFCHSGIENIVQ